MILFIYLILITRWEWQFISSITAVLLKFYKSSLLQYLLSDSIAKRDIWKNRTSKIIYQKAKYQENPGLQLAYEKYKYLKWKKVIKKWSASQILKLENNIKRGTSKI